MRALLSFAQKHKAIIFYVTLIILALNAFIAWHVLSEKTIYYWDLAGYWTSAIGLSNTISSSYRDALDLLIASLTSDYNYLSIAPVAFLMHIFGNSRLVYVLSIVNLYIIPAILVGSYLVCKYIIPLHKAEAFPVIVAIFASLSAIMIPVFANMPDVAGLLVISLLLLVFAHSNILTSFTAKSFLIGALICLLIVLRRWYAFWILGAGVALACIVVYMLWMKNKQRINRALLLSFKWPVINGSVMILMFIAILVVCFPHTYESLIVDYGDVYAAYKSGGHMYHMVGTILHFGILTLLLSVAGYGFLFFSRYAAVAKYTASFFIISFVVIFLAFSNTQDFSPHHYYLLVPAILLGLTVFFYEITKRLKYGNIGVYIVAVWCVFMSLYSFSPLVTGNRVLMYVFGSQKPPLVNNDIKIVKDMANYLESKDKLVYVVASSTVFNDTTIRNIYLPDRLTKNVITTAHIDRRDGFPNAFFNAEYIIVPERVQTHAYNGQGQRVVSVLTEKILNNEAKNLIRTKTFTLNNGLSVYVYSKQAPYTAKFIMSLQKEFQKVYPGDPLFSDIKEDRNTIIEIQGMKESK